MKNANNINTNQNFDDFVRGYTSKLMNSFSNEMNLKIFYHKPNEPLIEIPPSTIISCPVIETISSFKSALTTRAISIG